MAPLYSYTVQECGDMPMVVSIACAEGRCGECAAWFRCDCAHHRAVAAMSRFTSAIERLEADPGVSADEVDALGARILSLADFDRLVDEIGAAPLTVDPLCPCPACCESRAGSASPESDG